MLARELCGGGIMVNEFYTVDRSSREVLALWQWAQTQCLGLITRDDLYALGILATLEYLSGVTDTMPQSIHIPDMPAGVDLFRRCGTLDALTPVFNFRLREDEQ